MLQSKFWKQNKTIKFRNFHKNLSIPVKVNSPFVHLSFYKFVKLEAPRFKETLFQDWGELQVKGRVYIGSEGINAQICLPQDNIDLFKDYLQRYASLRDIRLNFGLENNHNGFDKLHIRIRDEIVTSDCDIPTSSLSAQDNHIEATEWNNLINRSDTIVVDVRNRYESEVGYFEKAIRPEVYTFRESLPIIENIAKENPNNTILMYCTGGIRCEKASAYLQSKGFFNIKQLKGGVISYAQEVKNQRITSKFKGKNFFCV